MKIIDQDNPYFDIPTTFVIVKHDLFCLANSQLWNMKSSEKRILNEELLKDIVILKYKLKEKEIKYMLLEKIGHYR